MQRVHFFPFFYSIVMQGTETAVSTTLCKRDKKRKNLQDNLLSSVGFSQSSSRGVQSRRLTLSCLVLTLSVGNRPFAATIKSKKMLKIKVERKCSRREKGLALVDALKWSIY